MPEKVCEVCFKDFEGHFNAKVCSEKCRKERESTYNAQYYNARKVVTVGCSNCGGPVNRTSKYGFCSRNQECLNLARKASWAARTGYKPRNCVNCGADIVVRRNSPRNPYCCNNTECKALRAKWDHDRLITQVFDHYGHECTCCGYTERLSIDHIDGNGYEHRATGVKGYQFYRWLIKNGFPPGYQTLCGPCNTAKGRGDTCARHGKRLAMRFVYAVAVPRHDYSKVLGIIGSKF